VPDWTKGLPGPAPPGDVDQPLMTDPQWAAFVKDLVKGVDFGKAGVSVTATNTQIEVTRGPEQRFFVEGSNPGPWEKAKTVTLKNPHRDCTRWRRRYASITYRYYEKITVTVVITYTKDGAQQTWRSDPRVFWLYKPPPFTFPNIYIYRWKRSSWEERVYTGETIVGPVYETAEVDDLTPPDDEARPDNDTDTPYPDNDLKDPPTTLWFSLRSSDDHPLELATSAFASTTDEVVRWHPATPEQSPDAERTVRSDPLPLSEVLKISDLG
jgi:hypothetical protein